MTTLPIGADSPAYLEELIQRLEVRDAMTTTVVTAAPGQSLRDVQALDGGYTGDQVVVDADEMVGEYDAIEMAGIAGRIDPGDRVSALSRPRSPTAG